MAKSKGGKTSATKMAEGNVRVAEIETAAKSTMEPYSYEKGYPHQKGVIYPGKFNISKGKPGGN